MQVVHGTAKLPRKPSQPVVAIGNFDGVHLGHQEILRTTVAHARQLGGEACVLTFDPHPAKLLVPDRAPALLTTPARKLAEMAQLGLDLAVVEPFTRAFSRIEADAFLRDIVFTRLGPREICIGYDFRFGRDRHGTPARLREIAEPAGIRVTVFDPVRAPGTSGAETREVVSSTRIRALLAEGQVERARALLGRPFVVDGAVVRGAGRGRTLGVPTVNVAPRTEAIPRRGVYAGFVERASGERLPAAINVGLNPTFAPGAGASTAGPPLSVEAHILDFSGDLYGEVLAIGFCSRLRDEQKFAGPAELIAQIRADLGRSRALLAHDDVLRAPHEPARDR